MLFQDIKKKPLKHAAVQTTPEEIASSDEDDAFQRNLKECKALMMKMKVLQCYIHTLK